MQRKPFKFRYIHRIVGSFLLFAVAVLVLLAVLVIKNQAWFAEVTEYRVEMSPRRSGTPDAASDPADEGTLGIRAGSAVRVIGNQVGFVDRVELRTGESLAPIESFESVAPEDIRIVAILRVRGEFSHFIGPGSEAVLKYDLGGLGSAYFDITRGTGRFPESAPDAPPRLLPFRQEEDAKEEIFATVRRIEDEIIPALQSYRETAETMTAFVQKLSDDNELLMGALGSLEQSTDRLDVILARIESGEGVLGDMTSSESEMRRELNEFAVTLNRSTNQLEDAINDLQEGFVNLDEGITELRTGGVASFTEAADGFPGTIARANRAIDGYGAAAGQLSETLREIEVLTEALQRHWLVRKRVIDPVEDPVTPPSSPSTDRPRTTSRSTPPQGRSTEPEEKKNGLRLFRKSEDEEGGKLRKLFGSREGKHAD